MTRDKKWDAYFKRVDELREKYGCVPGPFFSTMECRSANQKNKRSSEFLEIHHVMEHEVPCLSEKSVALENPWNYQLPPNLVYANIIEHLELHIIILETNGHWGGAAITLMAINDIYRGYPFKRTYTKERAKFILENYSKEYFDSLVERVKKAMPKHHELVENKKAIFKERFEQIRDEYFAKKFGKNWRDKPKRNLNFAKHFKNILGLYKERYGDKV